MLKRAALACLSVACLPAAAAAQSPGASESLTEPTVAQMVSSSPQPGERGLQAMFGFQWQDGATNTRGLSINLIGAHTLKNRSLTRLDVEIERAQYKPHTDASFVTVENAVKVQQTYMHLFKKHWMAIGSANYRRDTVIKLDYRASVDVGVGAKFLDHRRVKALAGVTYGLGTQRRAFLPSSTRVTAVGFMDSVVVALSPTARLEQWLQYTADTSNSDDKTYALNVSLISRINRHFGVKVYYQRQYDALHPATQPEHQQELGAGLTISFQPSPQRPAATP